MNHIKIIQLNLNGQQTASEQLRDRVIKGKIDIALVQEPPTNENGLVINFEKCQQVSNFDKPGAAIIITSDRIKCINIAQHTSQYVAVAKISPNGRDESSVVLVSAYFKYNRPTTDFTERIRSIAQDHSSLLICADSNGHSTRWHNQNTNARGRTIEEMIDDLLLHIHNVPNSTPTYERAHMGSSNIDLTLTTPNLKRHIKNWAVENDTDSDHNSLSFELHTEMKVPNEVKTVTFNVGKADWSKFQNTLAQLNQLADDAVSDIHTRAVTLTDIIRNAAIKSIPLKRRRRNLATLPSWWNDELSDSKRTLNFARRNKCPNYAALRNRHLHLIRSAKMDAWRTFSEEMNTNTWGKAFNWAKKGSSTNKGPSTIKNKEGRYTKNIEETIDTLLDAFLPDDHTPSELIMAPQDGRPMTSATYDEVKSSIWKLKPSKAPGKDGITGGMLRKAWPTLSQRIIDLFNQCLLSETFPTPWKEANLIIIPKPGKKDRTSTGAYRPISLVPTLGKALESLIIKRLEDETNVNTIGEQHGYTSTKSTVTAIKAAYEWVDRCPNRHITGVFLDITGAFDHVRWNPLLDAARTLGASSKIINILISYLKDRTASLEIDGITRQKTMTRGCPQGSRLGPTIWKLAMVGAFCEDPATSKTIAYADDIVVMTGGARIPTIIKRLEKNLDTLIEWSERYGLTFSKNKCEAMSMKGGKKTPYSIGFGSDTSNGTINGKDSVKYLGVIIDPRRSYWDHIASLSEKSTGMFRRLRQMTSANWGVSQTTSMIIYKAVFLPRITYAAEIWSKGLELKKSIGKMESIQREALKAVTGAYNTTSTAALQVIAGLLPLDLEVKKHCEKMNLRCGKITPDEYEDRIEEFLDTWQERWNPTQHSPTTGDWTRKLIPDVRVRYGLPIRMNHYLSQMLTGHGDFYGKLHSFKLVPSPNCRCGNGSETVQHVLLMCPRTTTQRNELKKIIEEEGGSWPPYNGTIIKTRKIFEAYSKFAQDSLKSRTDR